MVPTSNPLLNKKILYSKKHFQSNALFLYVIKRMQIVTWDMVQWLLIESLRRDRLESLNYLLETYSLYFKGVFDGLSDIPLNTQSVAALQRIFAFGFKGDLTLVLLNALANSNSTGKNEVQLLSSKRRYKTMSHGL